MIRTVILAALCILLASNAEARHRSVQPACVEIGSVLHPSCMGGDFLAGVRSIRVTMHRERRSEGSRPAGCPHAWCGCWLARHLGIPDRSLWLARKWVGIGSNAGGPGQNVIAVWPHHVGLIRAVEGNRILLLSGNDGHAVRERWRSTAGIIAYRVM